MISANSGIIESYDLYDGLVKVVIRRDPETGVFIYEVIEPELPARLNEVLDRIRRHLLSTGFTNPNLIAFREAPRKFVDDLLKSVLDALKIKLNDDDYRKIAYYIMRDIAGYGKIDPLLADRYIEDIHINGPNRPIYVWHSRYEHLRTNVTLSPDELDSLIVKISQKCGKQISTAQPVLEGLLPEGIRVEIALKEIAPYGPIITFRRFKAEPFTIVDLIISRVLNAEMAAFLWFMLDNRVSIVIFGPTGAGKTTLLNALLYLIRSECRVVTIEDTREISIPHEQWVPLTTRESVSPDVMNVDMYQLVKISMRIRPDYLIVGELRGSEAYAFFQGIASGHTGLTTIHADSVESVIRRLTSQPMNVPTSLIPVAKIYVEIGRAKVNEFVYRKVLSITELVDIKDDTPILNALWIWDRHTQDFIKVGESKVLRELIERGRVREDEARAELERRKMLLEAMARYGFRSPEIVFRITRNYYRDPEYTLKRVLGGELP